MRRLALLTAATVTWVGCTATAHPAPHVTHHVARHASPPSHSGHPAAARTSKLPHVFLVVLENESYTSSYVNNPHRYLGHRLQHQGTLLTHYYGTGHHSLDNYISMMSGQAPNLVTSADCPRYTDFNATTAPATIGAGGQAVGAGCVYPSNVHTLADQLSKAHVSWRGYMDQMGRDTSREPKRCGVPHLNALGIDDTQAATAKDQYAARHNPFVYFHSLIDSGLCRKHVVPLTDLRHDLKYPSTTPHFSFITPDLCDDGHDAPCAGKDARGSKAGGLASVDHFLSLWVPRIEKSSAYRHNGLIIVTSDESASSDATGCCNEQPGPSDPLPGITGPGGGRTGTLVLGHCIRRGARDPHPYNHYSLLRSLENLFRIRHGGTDGKGHLGYAAAKGLRPFGSDVYARCRYG